MSFRRLNCAAIPETPLESEIFGHEKGAFAQNLAGQAAELAAQLAGRSVEVVVFPSFPVTIVNILRLT